PVAITFARSYPYRTRAIFFSGFVTHTGAATVSPTLNLVSKSVPLLFHDIFYNVLFESDCFDYSGVYGFRAVMQVCDKVDIEYRPSLSGSVNSLLALLIQGQPVSHGIIHQ